MHSLSVLLTATLVLSPVAATGVATQASIRDTPRQAELTASLRVTCPLLLHYIKWC